MVFVEDYFHLCYCVWNETVKKSSSNYFGTPNTEILKNLSGSPKICAEGTPNVKVALEATKILLMVI